MAAKSAASEPRNPDTNADAGGKVNAEDYGFRAIEETDPAEGPGAIEPTRVEPVSSVPNSTFASRSGKAVQGAESKAIQGAENK